MKPSPLLMKAGLVVGLGTLAWVSPSPAIVIRGCVFLVQECPADPEWYCQYYGCSVADAMCGWMSNYPITGQGGFYVFCEGGET
jgi:hypothetical protein